MSRAITVQADWISGYATTVEQAGGDLADALRALTGTPLGATAFGSLGRAAGAPDAYGRASTELQGQVARAADALRAAAANLHTIAGAHTSLDEQQAAALARVHPG